MDRTTPRLQRISTAVPWPRGLAFRRTRLFALSRGCPRGSGGPHKFVFDGGGTIFTLRSDKWESVTEANEVTAAIRKNGKKFAEPDPNVFNLWSREQKQPFDDIETDRPYATLVWDRKSRNFYICGFSGIDNAPNDRRFRKNGTDSILRYDTRSKTWHVVERHDATLIPMDLRRDPTTVHFSSEYYEPKAQSPRGWLNGPDSLLVVGKSLYAAAKDNHSVVQYDLSEIRKNPDAGAPPSQLVLSGRQMGGVEGTRGPSALARAGDYLYVGFRSTGRIVRFRMRGDDLASPLDAKLVADLGGDAQLIDMTARGTSELIVSMKKGEVWRIPIGEGSVYRRAENRPLFFIEGESLSNITLDRRGRIYICTNNWDDRSRKFAGTIYRIVE